MKSATTLPRLRSVRKQQTVPWREVPLWLAAGLFAVAIRMFIPQVQPRKKHDGYFGGQEVGNSWDNMTDAERDDL